MRTALIGSCLALAFVLPALARDRLPPPPRELANLTLPSAPLRFLFNSKTMADFIDLGRSDRANHTLILYKVLDPPFHLSYGDASQIVSRLHFDCQAHTATEMGSQEFDDTGLLVLWEPVQPTQAVRAHTGLDLLEGYACRGEAAPDTPDIVGWQTALKRGRAILKGG